MDRKEQKCKHVSMGERGKKKKKKKKKKEHPVRHGEPPEEGSHSTKNVKKKTPHARQQRSRVHNRTTAAMSTSVPSYRSSLRGLKTSSKFFQGPREKGLVNWPPSQKWAYLDKILVVFGCLCLL